MSAIQAEQGNDDLAKSFATFSSKMSQTRANLRLLDDIPMIQYSMEYGLGGKEPDKIMSSIGVLTNVIDHFYYPVDKICWALDAGILKWEKRDKWDFINSMCWASSIYMNLMEWV